MPELARVEIEKDDLGWVLTVTYPGSSQRPQNYRCASREQAQALADVLTGNKVSSGLKAQKPKPGAVPPPGSAPLKAPPKK